MRMKFTKNFVFIGIFTVLSGMAYAVDSPQFESGDWKGKFNGLFQLWGIGNYEKPTNHQYLRIRRAEIKLSGSYLKDWKYFLMIDPARLLRAPGSSQPPIGNALQDFGVGYPPAENFEITVGQFKPPITAEGLDPSSGLALPERSLLTRVYDERRELGLRLSYKQENWNVASMLSTGVPVSADESQTLQDLNTRAEWNPQKDSSIGAFITIGKWSYSKKGRWGLNLRTKEEKFELSAEYVQGKDGARHSKGFTTEIGYWLQEDLEPIFRLELFSPDQSIKTSGKAQTLGVNYILSKSNLKLQFAVSALQHMAAPNGSPVFSKGSIHKLAVIAFQASI